MEDRPANVQVVSRLRWDGARYAQHAARQPGQKGRRRRRGDRLAALQLWGAKPRAGSIGDAYGVLELLWRLVTTVQAWMRPRQDLVLENLLLRHQLAVLARPTRTRPRARLRTWDKLLWVLVRRWCAGWRERLRLVTPDTVVRWHRQAGASSGAGRSIREVDAHVSAPRCGSSS